MSARACKAETADRRFWSKVRGGDVSECWEWQAVTVDGYGSFQMTHTKVRAHRLSYEWLIGPIPDGLMLDHLCRNRKCVNPYHMDPVPNVVNARRGATCRATEDRCANGHPWSAETWRIGKRNLRICPTCAALNSRAWRRRASVAA